MEKEMQRECKTLPLFKMPGDTGRMRTGIAAVYGNIDSGNDRLHYGAFTKTISEGVIRHKHLWSHDWGHPPIASIKELREIGRDELPAAVLAYAPDATGGLLVKREYFNSDLADLVLQGIDSGDMEMSIGYAPKQFEYTQVKGEMDIRELREVQLMETSDVPFGMNNATVAAFAKSLTTGRPLGALLGELQIMLHNVKAGRRNNSQDAANIELLHKISLDLGYENCKMLTDEGEKSLLPTNNAISGEAESVINTDNSLLANELKINDLRLSQLLRSENYVSTSSKTEGISG